MDAGSLGHEKESSEKKEYRQWTENKTAKQRNAKERETHMQLMDDGIKLNVRLDMPENAPEKLPLVVILHGFTGHMEERHLTAVSQSLNAVGFATLRADLYGHGNSGGEFRKHTLYKWMTNAMTLIDYARGLDFVTDIYLCGHSQGGLTAVLTAALEHDRIKGLIALAPALMIPEAARQGTLLGQDFDPDHIPDVLPAWNNQVLESNYVRVAQTIHVEEAIDRYSGPVLIVQGDNDMPDLMQSAITAAKRYQHCSLVMIPGDTHCFDHHLDQVTDAVRQWISERRA